MELVIALINWISSTKAGQRLLCTMAGFFVILFLCAFLTPKSLETRTWFFVVVIILTMAAATLIAEAIVGLG